MYAIQKNSFPDELEENGYIILENFLDEDLISHIQIFSFFMFNIVDSISAGFHKVRDENFMKYIREFYDKSDFITQDVMDGYLYRYEMHRPVGLERFASNIRDMLTSQFGFSEIKFLRERSVLRRQKIARNSTPNSYVTWHRDIHAVGTEEAGECFNAWIPLCSVGTNVPSLDLRPGSHRLYRSIPVPDQTTRDVEAEIRSDEVIGNDSYETAVLNVGDVLLFDHQLIHRTQRVDNQARDRMSAELRFSYVR